MTTSFPLVLIVDDNDDAQVSLADLLRHSEYRVVIAATAADAFREARRQPDVIILDVCLPDLSGIEVCRRLKADPNTALTPVLMLSGRAVTDDDQADGLDSGADAYLIKPVGPGVILAQVKALLRICRADHLYRRALRAVTQGILITDPSLPDNPIVYINPAFEQMTGYAADELVGRNCRLLQGPGTDPAAVARIRDAVAAGRAVNEDLLNYRKDGTPFWTRLSITPVWDAGGGITHFVGVQSDITEQRALEDRLRQAQKMEAFGQLAGGVAHDFNNLLTVINGYSEVLLGELPPADARRDQIASILQAGDRAAWLTGQLLAFSRKAIVAPKVLDLNDVVEQLGTLLRRLIGEDVRFATALAPELSRVRADRGQLEQVLMNLAVNARDAMPTGGRLTVATANVEVHPDDAPLFSDCPPGRYVRLAVTDTGTGMTDEVRANIFEPFFTTKEVGKGTGMGLATVYGIVKQADGHIAVRTAVGCGTTFEVYLPRASGPAQMAPVAPVDLHGIPRGTETVLLAEDEDIVRAFGRFVLEQAGYTVLEARDGAHGVRVAAAHPGPIDLLITDVVMPGVGGRVLAEQLLAARPSLRVLFLSGHTDDALIRNGVLESEVDFLHKPFVPRGLVGKVREVLDSARPVAGGEPVVASGQRA